MGFIYRDQLFVRYNRTNPYSPFLYNVEAFK